MHLLIASLFLLTIAQAQAPPYGLTQRIPNQDFRISSSGYALTDMRLQRLYPTLSFSEPLYLTHAGDQSNRLFVVEKAGKIKVFPKDNHTDSLTLFLDIEDRVADFRPEIGLLGLAFHPRYADNGRFYVYYIARNIVSRLSEFRVSDDPDVADPASERIILQFSQPSETHNGGQIAFGPDGFLYMGLGDGGDPNDRFENAQDPTTLMGTILRLDIDPTQAGRRYAIPPDNPFVGNDRNWREEIWAWGLRNPWRFSFDRLTGQLWAGDVGQHNWEEIDLIEKGGNYGWNILEGVACLTDNDCDSSGFVPPVLVYDHSQGRAITGGYVYRGDRLIRLQGTYLYGDFGTRLIWGLRYEDGQVVDNRVIASSPQPLPSFGEDEDGEVYILGLNGGIFTLQEKNSAEPVGRIPTTISSSGVFADVVAQTPSPGLIPYSVNSPLWSDGTTKTRFLALPGQEQITFSRAGSWQFPPGTALVKNFYLDMEAGNPQSRRIIETRFLVKRDNDPSWDGFSYMWNAAGSDAVLLEGAHTATFNIVDPTAPDGVRQQQHYFPSRADCNTCHTPAAGFVLGVRTAQLNGDHDYGGTIDNQLRTLNHIGLFNTDIGENYADFSRLPDPFDERLPLELRARSYLDANCSQCHRPGGSGRSNMDLRFSTPLAQTHTLDTPPVYGDLDTIDAQRIQPGDANLSVLYLRMLALDHRRMPPLATARVDLQGTALIRRWINGNPTAVALAHLTRPHTFSLQQNYPNPFNSSTLIPYQVDRMTHVHLAIFSLSGQLVKKLIDVPQLAGAYQAVWNGTDRHQHPVASGLYLVRLQNANQSQTRKLILLK